VITSTSAFSGDAAGVETSVNLALALSPSPGKAEFMPTIHAVFMSLPARAALCIECLEVRTSLRSDEIIGRLDALGAKAADGDCARCAKFGPVFSVARMATNALAVTEAIREAALCTMCIARKIGAAPLSVLSALAHIGQRAKITEALTRCDGCLQLKPTHRV
jgi:hypothetical protein